MALFYETFFLQGLAVAHDDLVNRSYTEETLPDVPHEVDEDEEAIKIVRIIKGDLEPLVSSVAFRDEKFLNVFLFLINRKKMK